MHTLSKTVRLRKLARRLATCIACPGLNIPQETMSAPPYGCPDSPVMLVGQSLHSYNRETPRRQIPFVGPSFIRDSGNVLIETIEAAGFKFADLFTTNVVHCHPPDNRASKPAETMACRHFLLTEIDIVRPKLIVALGNPAGIALDISVRNRVVPIHLRLQHGSFRTAGLLVYHPAYILRLEKVPEEASRIAEWGATFTYYLQCYMNGDPPK